MGLMKSYGKNYAGWAGGILFLGVIITVIMTGLDRFHPLRFGENPPAAARPTASSSTSIRPEVVDLAGEKSNRLIHEKSPYLLQHAHDPVDWYPWGSEAFEVARRENKPIFLSIGYSTCHWCHVMLEESFNDPEVARLLNETFINIIVDREERPDIDGIYTYVAVSMNGTSGWPLNVIMTSDQKPFYAATYIPKQNRFGRIGMLDLIPQLQDAWEGQNPDLMDIAERVSLKVNQTAASSSRGQLTLDEPLLERTYQQLVRQYDTGNGGFGTQPKFPTPHKMLFLLRYWERTGDQDALKMVETSLHAMRRGGIYDQLGFGFHRYATDAAWRMPHFEKMLYDQALLAMVYTEAYQATGKSEYAQSAHEILAYVLRDLTAASGGFYSAEDADSMGEEGAFYLWTADEIRSILGREEAELFIRAYNVTDEGNYIDPNLGTPSAKNVLFLGNSTMKLARELRVPQADLAVSLEAARQQLFMARGARFDLHRDDKILTGWNGLMITALAKAGQAYDDPVYTEAARKSADFILEDATDKDGRLLHLYAEDDSGLPANLDDYAFFTWGLVDLYEATFDPHYLERALSLTDDLLDHFWDETDGGFYFTADDSENLLVRQKIIKDTDLPSGNSVAMLNLLRLGRLTANAALEEKAVDIVQAFASRIEGTPADYSLLMSAVDMGVGPSYEIVISGDPLAADTQAMANALRREFIPNKVVLLRPPGESPRIVELADFTRNHFSLDGRATAYVCLGYYCKRPTTEIDQMLAFLGRR